MRCAVLCVVALFVAGCEGSTGSVPPRPGIDHVIVISVDGLRGDVLDLKALKESHGLGRLMRGPHTLDARCDPGVSVTLPNHVGIATGRLFAGEHGHGWLGNDLPPKPEMGGTLEQMHGSYVPSMFDVASDDSVATSLIAQKAKFVLFDQSFDSAHGAPDKVGRDDGTDKIDEFLVGDSCEAIVREVLRSLKERSNSRSLMMVHFGDADGAGHAAGWELADSSEYRLAIARVDQSIAALLAGIDDDRLLSGRVAIVLTSDHGGGVPLKSHTDPTAPINFTIPFLVWNGRDSAPSDLYELNRESRHRPEPTKNPSASESPPIRNADAANLALDLLGLPPIAGSTVNGHQNLRTTPSGGTTPR